jgi:hypothetical protein
MVSTNVGRSASPPQASRPHGHFMGRVSTAARPPTGGRSPSRQRRTSGADIAARRRATARGSRVSAPAGLPSGRGVPSPVAISCRLTRVAQGRCGCNRSTRGGWARPRAARQRAHARGPPRQRPPAGGHASPAAERPHPASPRAGGTDHPVAWRPAALCPAGRWAVWGRACLFGPGILGRRRLPGHPFPLCPPLPSPQTMRGADALTVFGPPGPVRAAHVLDASLHASHALGGPRQPLGTLTPTLPLGRLLARSHPRRRQEPRDRGGLTRQGVRSPRRSPWCPGYASPVSCGAPLLHRRNTRSAWWVRPDAAGTCTRQDTPSFAWRTNARGEPPLEAQRSRSWRQSAPVPGLAMLRR